MGMTQKAEQSVSFRLMAVRIGIVGSSMRFCRGYRVLTGKRYQKHARRYPNRIDGEHE